MLHFEPKDIPVKKTFDLLLGGVGPRPIALVSTISESGNVNLSPFSFFNAFGSNPPTVGFSPSRRLRDASTKHTYENLKATKECVIQAVTYSMVQQVSLASTEYAEGVDEFIKSGLTPEKSDLVKPPRVLESPFQMECRLVQMIELGGKHASGNLALCEVVKFHVREELFDGDVIHPQKIDLVARMGGDFYCRASGEAIFMVKKPVLTRGIGYDQLPKFIRESDILTANNLGQLGNIEWVPSESEVREFIARYRVSDSQRDEKAYEVMLRQILSGNSQTDRERALFQVAKQALVEDEQEFAWKVLLCADMLRRERE